MTKLYTPYIDYLDKMSERDTLRQLKSIDRCNSKGEKSSRFIQYQNQSYVNLSSNDYLALSCHPQLIESSTKWAQKYGTGSGSSRLVTGNLSIFKDVEEKLALLKKKQSALIMGAGFQTNATILQALFSKQILKDQPLVFSDRLNHASIHFGCAAAHITQIRYHHADAKHLKLRLEHYKYSKQPKYIITETIFSMDGDQAPLKEIVQLARDNQAILIIDDAHSIGMFDKYAQKADIIIGTFSKAFGSYGAYVAANQTIINYLKNKCHGFIYSTALPPPTLGAINAAIDLMPNLQSERSHLNKLTHFFRLALQQKNLNIANSTSHIIPLIMKDTQAVMSLSDKLKQNNIWATPIRYPTVSQSTPRIRFSFSSALSEQDIEKTLSCII